MDNIIFTISIVLNIVLGLIAFFKTGLNEVLTELGKSWIERRKLRRDTLIRIHSLVKKLKINAFITLVEVGQMEERIVENSGFKSTFMKEWSEMNSEVEAKDLFRPKNARRLYRKFRRTVQKYGSEITREHPGKLRYIEMNSDIEAIVGELLEAIEKKI